MKTMTLERLERIIEALLETEQESLARTNPVKELTEFTKRKGTIAGYKQGLDAVKRINNSELYADVLALVDKKIESYEDRKEDSVMELDVTPENFEARNNILFYDNVIETLTSCRDAIVDLLP